MRSFSVLTTWSILLMVTSTLQGQEDGGKWLVHTSTDEMDDIQRFSVVLPADEVMSGDPGEGATFLLIACANEKAPRVAIQMHSIIDGELTDEGLKVRVRTRLDQAPARTEMWLVGKDLTSVVSSPSFDRVRRLAKASMYRVEIPVSLGPRVVLRYDVRGLSVHIPVLSSNCRNRT